MTSRRSTLANIKSDMVKTANAGLWLTKYLDKKSENDKTARTTLVKEVVEKASNQELQSLYRRFFERWKETLEAYGAETRKTQVRGRMVIGLGSESVLETAVTLHHTYGVPYIPGSALKGLARNFARNMEGWTDKHSEVVFGNEKKRDNNTFAGFITFFDALLIPDEYGNKRALHTDVMTVHHQGYYMGAGVPPADWDDPIPVSFLSATGTYLLALAGPAEWISPTFKLLEIALKEEGVGAKTSSGYGRMIFV